MEIHRRVPALPCSLESLVAPTHPIPSSFSAVGPSRRAARACHPESPRPRRSLFTVWLWAFWLAFSPSLLLCARHPIVFAAWANKIYNHVWLSATLAPSAAIELLDRFLIHSNLSYSGLSYAEHAPASRGSMSGPVSNTRTRVMRDLPVT